MQVTPVFFMTSVIILRKAFYGHSGHGRRPQGRADHGQANSGLIVTNRQQRSSGPDSYPSGPPRFADLLGGALRCMAEFDKDRIDCFYW